MREFGNFCFHHKGFFGCFSRVIIGHDARIAPSSTLENPSENSFVLKAFKFKHSLRG